MLIMRNLFIFPFIHLSRNIRWFVSMNHQNLYGYYLETQLLERYSNLHYFSTIENYIFYVLVSAHSLGNLWRW